jgi:hypothetical protein
MLFSCEKKESGTVDIEGYLIYSLDDKRPVSSAELSFQSGYSSDISTKTNELGYFRIQGNYSYTWNTWHSPEPGGNQLKILFSDSLFSIEERLYDFDDELDLDTIYLVHNTNSVFIFVVPDESKYDEFDTLEFEIFLPNDNPNRIEYRKIPGPFVNASILDTLQTRVAPHLGYGHEYSRAGQGIMNQGEFRLDCFYPFVRGQSNNHTNEFTIVEIKLK